MSIGGTMSEANQAQGAVLATTEQELRRVGAEQQALADDLSTLLEQPSDALVRRLQDFDRLRQKIDQLAGVLAVLRSTPAAELPAAVPASLVLTELRQAFCAALGVATDAPAAQGEDDIELF